MKITLTETPTRELTLTATPIPSTTPQPLRSSSPTVASPEPTVILPGIETGSGQSSVIIVAASIIGLVVVGYLAMKRLRKSAGK